jgi:hypothetical protein
VCLFRVHISRVFFIVVINDPAFLPFGKLTALANRELIMSLKIIRRARLIYPAMCRPCEYLPANTVSAPRLNRVLFAANSTRDSIVIERG